MPRACSLGRGGPILRPCRTLHAGSAHADRVTERLLYQRQRVGTYGIVDPDARCGEVWHPESERSALVTAVLRWRVTEGAPETEIALDHVFRGMPGQEAD